MHLLAACHLATLLLSAVDPAANKGRVQSIVQSRCCWATPWPAAAFVAFHPPQLAINGVQDRLGRRPQDPRISSNQQQQLHEPHNLANGAADLEDWPTTSNNIKSYHLAEDESVSCVLWNDLFYITGTDIVRALMFRFEAFGRKVTMAKKFEEGVFSDLRALKPGYGASLEMPRSDFLKKQKVFFWFSVDHDKLFLEALDRDLRRERANQEPTTVSLLHLDPDTSMQLAIQHVAAFPFTPIPAGTSLPAPAPVPAPTPVPAHAAPRMQSQSPMPPQEQYHNPHHIVMQAAMPHDQSPMQMRVHLPPPADMVSLSMGTPLLTPRTVATFSAAAAAAAANAVASAAAAAAAVSAKSSPAMIHRSPIPISDQLQFHPHPHALNPPSVISRHGSPDHSMNHPNIAPVPALASADHFDDQRADHGDDTSPELATPSPKYSDANTNNHAIMQDMGMPPVYETQSSLSTLLYKNGVGLAKTGSLPSFDYAAPVVMQVQSMQESTSLRSNSEGKAIPCPVASCGRQFKKQEQLRRHMRVHSSAAGGVMDRPGNSHLRAFSHLSHGSAGDNFSDTASNSGDGAYTPPVLTHYGSDAIADAAAHAAVTVASTMAHGNASADELLDSVFVRPSSVNNMGGMHQMLRMPSEMHTNMHDDPLSFGSHMRGASASSNNNGNSNRGMRAGMMPPQPPMLRTNQHGKDLILSSAIPPTPTTTLLVSSLMSDPEPSLGLSSTNLFGLSHDSVPHPFESETSSLHTEPHAFFT
ncbi:STE like transcription factor-domain-containing protein [Entophlyctis helioformis]|nr:STE like transcription factor-domain-containing protein [Entophlyctis helioformis]